MSPYLSWRRPGTGFGELSTEAAFEFLGEGGVSERSPGGLCRTDTLGRFSVIAPSKQTLEIRNPIEQWAHVDETIVPSRQMSERAGPGPVLGAAHKPGADRIHGHIARRRH